MMGFITGSGSKPHKTAKFRYKVTLHDPQNHITRTILVPHAPDETILALRQAAIFRATKMGFSSPTSCPEPYACLGGIDGGQLYDDDILEEVILDPAMEEIWFIFAQPGSDDWKIVNVNERGLNLNTHSSDGINSISTSDILTPLNICIITPELARTTSRPIPKLPTHLGITRKSTWKQLKDVIGEHYFGVDLTPGGLYPRYEDEECNCLIARKLVRGGTREHVSFVREGSGSDLTCDICSKALIEPCPQCTLLVDEDDSGIQMIRCGMYLKHVGCQHVFHQHCSENVEKDHGCPARNKPHASDSDSPRNREYVPVTTTDPFLVVVYERTEIVKIPLPSLPFSSTTRLRLSVAEFKHILRNSNVWGKAWSFTNKVAHIFGATAECDLQQEGNQSGDIESNRLLPETWLTFEYSCVVSICSIKKHPHSPKDNTSPTPRLITLCDLSSAVTDIYADTQDTATNSAQVIPEMQYDVDIHTVDAPIVCLDEPTELGQLHLDDSAVGNVINLYVTLRSSDKSHKLPRSDEPKPGNISGMDEIFTERDHWRLPVSQSERGVATFLSSTRVFANKIAKADRPTQNSVLALFIHLTDFPPILRSLHTLMMGKALTPADSAVLVQCVYELTKELLTPGHIIENKKERFLEGSRLFYYLAIEIAHTFFHDPEATEYLDSMKHVNLMGAETFQALKDPISTNLGIIEAAYFKALTDGLLAGLDAVTATPPNEDAMRVLKLAKRTGGTMSGITVFETDVLQLALQSRRGNISRLNSASSAKYNQFSISASPRELNYNIQELCQQSAVGTFAVVRPINLRLQSIEAPTLTMDSNGLMAVYVGRPPCAPPDRDVSIFCPTRGGVVDIDVALVTQLLEPILTQRMGDNSIALDSMGEAEAKVHKAPSEIIMLCVDCSTSMTSTAGFDDLNEGEDEDEDEDEDDDEGNCEDGDLGGAVGGVGQLANLQKEAEATLAADENLGQILAAIRARAFNFAKENLASKALEVMISLYQAELKHFKAERTAQQMSFTSRFLQSAAYIHGNPTVLRIKKLEAKVRSLKGANSEDLVRYLLDQASKYTGTGSKTLASQLVVSNNSTTFPWPESAAPLQVPSNLRCPISFDLLKTPVVAQDGVTYEKDHIEKWFQTTGTNNSPLTGLPMGATLLPNRTLSTQIIEWRNGVDIIKAEIDQAQGHTNIPPSQIGRGRGRASNSNSFGLGTELIIITIIMDTSEWKFRVPRRIRYATLRALAFRCLNGETTTFTLLHNGEHLPLDQTLSEPAVFIHPGMTIAIRKNTMLCRLDFASASAARHSVPPERVLVKVYRRSQRTAPAFAFWILKSTQSNVSSVIWQYWTRNQTSPIDFAVWERVRYQGDGRITGYSLHAWQPLSEVINRGMIEGTTENNDPMYQTVVEDKVESLDSDMASIIPSKNRAKVLKLVIIENSNTQKQKKRAGMRKDLTRIDVVKQVFDSYINRTIAYNISNHIGLITFATKAAVKQEITGVIEDFRGALKNLECEGDTAMWDALKLAAECLNMYSTKYPEAKKRIVCLSDGIDTNSKSEGWRLCQELQENNIVVDSISIGMNNDSNLRGVSYGTGGYKFSPRNLESAAAICELETVLSQTERPEIPVPDVHLGQNKSSSAILRFREYTKLAKADVVNEDVYPPRKSHPNLQDEFIAISAMLHKGGNRQSRQVASSTGFRLGDSRLLHETRLIATNNQPYYDVYASESNMRFWKVVMEAPADSTYSRGTYLLYLDMGANFPRTPPEARFVTPILHPNVNKHGRICHSILDRDWTSDTTLAALLNVIWSLLLIPSGSDFVDVVISLNYRWDEVGHQDRVRAHVQKHATRTREQWKYEITGDE